MNKQALSGTIAGGSRRLAVSGFGKQRLSGSVSSAAESMESEIQMGTVYGVDGGYYIPSVDDEGDLTWKPSKQGMPEIEGANIKGRPGDPGYTPVKNVDYFDGYTPVKGEDYFDGYTPQKGIDYFDGYTPQKGIDYFDGKPGYTPQKGVDYFDGEPGYTPIKGVDYFDWEPGYTPVKGVDYFTAEEVQALRDEIVDGVLFTDAEYIKGDAKAYILTDYIPNSNTRVTGKMYFNPGSSVKCMLGARTSTSSKRFDFGNNGSSKYNFGWNTAATAGTMTELPDAFEVDINRNTVYINGEEAITRTDAEFACEYPLAIFGCNTEGTVGSLATAGATIYWLKVYEGDVLLHDFHPRKHLVDGYGLYDRVAKKFYPNAATSGAFTGA